ncbi:MAG: hypothetical protein RSD63_08680 [Eubacterium sp.]
MEIILNKGEKSERTLVMARKKARFVREALKVQEDILKTKTGEELNAILSVVVKWYDDLSIDDVYDGIYSDELTAFILNSAQFIISGTLAIIQSKND